MVQFHDSNRFEGYSFRLGSGVRPEQSVGPVTEPLTHPLLAEYPIVIAVDVAWGDMDAYQHVNNTRYFRYAETGRIAYFQTVGFRPGQSDPGVGPILHSISCRFRIPVTYPDRVLVGTRVSDVGADRLTTQFRIVSLRHDAVAAEGEGIIVSFNYSTQQKAPVPQTVVDRIAAIQAP